MPILISRARAMRSNPTPAEALLWRLLRGRFLAGHKFRRQVPISGFILDFYCPAARLAVELDGPVHLQPGQAEHDILRSQTLAAHGVRVLRFNNDELSLNLNAVLDRIRAALAGG